MSLRFSAAHSSRINKNSKAPGLKRTASTPSPFASLPRRKPIQRSKTVQDADEDLFGDRLDDVGLVKALATDLSLRDVPQAIAYIRTRMFSDVPLQAAGMNSTRTAEVLNFRKNLPPIVTVSHVHALLNSPTTVEKEIAEMIRGGVVRKIVVPGRGGIGELLILQKDIEAMLEQNTDLDKSIKGRFLEFLASNRAALSIPRSRISESDAKELMNAGFLTSATPNWSSGDGFSRTAGDGSKGTLTSIDSISRAASGSMAAVGGEGVVHAAGGSGGRIRSSESSFSLAIPSIGPYLKLLVNARAHLVSLVSKARFREMPQSMLHERWDGGISGEDAASEARKMRGQFTGVFPGRTRKWKQFNGLSFTFIVEECVGAGQVEIFDTRSVGRGVRALS
jgi:hypothetical protein